MSQQLKEKFALIMGGVLLIIFLVFILAGFLSNNALTRVKEEEITISPSVQPRSSPSSAVQLVKVKRVVDGDTIEIESGQTVRYIGVDTPETVDPRRPVGCFGKEASIKNKELVEGKQVRLEKDVSETDKYGRLLRYVYIGNTFVNDYFVREGYAHASSYPPDIKYQDQFRQAEQEARDNNLGLWSSCQSSSINVSSSPEPPAALGTSGDCLIKGNISSSGEKIYHMVGQRYYEKTVIDTNVGERWFCVEGEAVAAGWRKSKV